jgi:hypothetical protein
MTAGGALLNTGLIDTALFKSLAVNRLQSLTPSFSDNSTSCRADRRSDPTPNDRTRERGARTPSCSGQITSRTDGLSSRPKKASGTTGKTLLPLLKVLDDVINASATAALLHVPVKHDAQIGDAMVCGGRGLLL